MEQERRRHGALRHVLALLALLGGLLAMHALGGGLHTAHAGAVPLAASAGAPTAVHAAAPPASASDLADPGVHLHDGPALTAGSDVPATRGEPASAFAAVCVAILLTALALARPALDVLARRRLHVRSGGRQAPAVWIRPPRDVLAELCVLRT